MLRLACPTGCAGFVPRPYPRRAEPVRCPNCRAWLAAPERAEDGGLCEAIILAVPGGALPPTGATATTTATTTRWLRSRLAAVAAAIVLAVLAAVLAAASLAQRARSAAGANDTRSAPTNSR